MQTAKCSNCGRYMGLGILDFYKRFYKKEGKTSFKFICPRCQCAIYNVGVNFKGDRLIDIERIK